MDKSKKATIIVGAGLTGLSAAWKLATHGRNCLLLEQASTPGGLAGSLFLDDILFDLGPHYFFPDQQSPGGRLINELLSEDGVITREFRYGIITDNHHFKMPIKGDILRYPLKYKQQILANLLFGSKSTAPKKSLCYFIESKFGRAYYTDAFGPMIRKKTGISGRNLHIDWYIRPERDPRNNRELLPPAASKRKRLLEPLKTFFSTNQYIYPQEGFGALADRLFSRYQDVDGAAVFDCNAIELVCNENQVQFCRVREKEFPVQDIVWTGSPEGLTSILPDPKNIKLPRIDTILILLTFNGKRLKANPYGYTYHPDEDLIFHRVYFPENIFQQRSPEDKEGVCLEINWFKGIGTMTEEDILKKAVDDIERLGFFKKDHLRFSRLIRLKNSLPVYGLNYEEQLTAYNRLTGKYKNLYSVGRTGGAFFCMSPAAVNQGLKTAEHILAIHHRHDVNK